MPESDDGTLQVVRSVPVPTSVSPEAQQMLRLGSALSAAAPALPALDDLDGWVTHIAAVDELIVAALAADADRVDADVAAEVVGGVPTFVVTPSELTPAGDGPVFLDIHGGGLVQGGGDACRVMARLAAGRTRMLTWSVDYRMPPAHPFPAAIDDCLAVYRELLGRRSPAEIAVGGASAGGNLAAAVLLRAREEGLPMPACLVLLSPEVDLTESGDSFETYLGIDTVLPGRLTESIALYADGHDLADPLLSPLFGDLVGFPPTFLQCGTRDLFLSNTVRMHRALRGAGVDAELHVFEAMPHGGFFGAPEDLEMAAEVRSFLARHLPTAT